MTIHSHQLGRYSKSPDERKRYTIEYSEWLDTDETLTLVEFEIDNTTNNPLVVDGSLIEPTDETLVSFFVSGGDDGETYKVVVTATTSGGQIKQAHVMFAVADC